MYVLQMFHYLLSQFSSLPGVRSQAKDLVAERLPLLISQLLSAEGQLLQSGLDHTPSYLITLTTLATSGQYSLKVDLVDRLFIHLRYQQPLSICPIALLPVIHGSVPPTEVATHTPSPTMAVNGGGLLDGALPDLVLEMGYHFTASVDECRASLLQLGGREVYAATVAKVIGVMVRTHTGLDDSSTFPLVCGKR